MQRPVTAITLKSALDEKKKEIVKGSKKRLEHMYEIGLSPNFIEREKGFFDKEKVPEDFIDVKDVSSPVDWYRPHLALQNLNVGDRQPQVV